MEQKSVSFCLATICLQFASIISGSGFVLFLTGAAAGTTIIYNIYGIIERNKKTPIWKRIFSKKTPKP